MIRKTILAVFITAAFLTACSKDAGNAAVATPSQLIQEEAPTSVEWTSPDIAPADTKTAVVLADGKESPCITKGETVYVDIEALAKFCGMENKTEATGDDGKAVWSFSGTAGTLTFIESTGQLIFGEDRAVVQSITNEDGRLFLSANALLVLPVDTTIYSEKGRRIYEIKR